MQWNVWVPDLEDMLFIKEKRPTLNASEKRFTFSPLDTFVSHVSHLRFLLIYQRLSFLICIW